MRISKHIKEVMGTLCPECFPDAEIIGQFSPELLLMKTTGETCGPVYSLVHTFYHAGCHNDVILSIAGVPRSKPSYNGTAASDSAFFKWQDELVVMTEGWSIQVAFAALLVDQCVQSGYQRIRGDFQSWVYNRIGQLIEYHKAQQEDEKAAELGWAKKDLPIPGVRETAEP